MSLLQNRFAPPGQARRHAFGRHAARHFHENSIGQSRQSAVRCRKLETGGFYSAQAASKIAAAGAAFGKVADRLVKFTQAGADFVDLRLLFVRDLRRPDRRTLRIGTCG